MFKRAIDRKFLHSLTTAAAVCFTLAAAISASTAAPVAPTPANAPTAPAATAASAAPATVTTMAMEGGCTFVFQLPEGYKLRERATPALGCDSMIWMAPGAATESDGASFQLAVIKPNTDMLKAMQDINLPQIAKSMLSGKAEGWAEFHPLEPAEVTISNVKYARIDFDGVRKSGASKITGFQLVGVYKDKLISIVVEVPEKLHSELEAFNRLVKTIQLQ